jgi:hypothetical protein
MGFANDWHLVHLGSRIIGGAGLIIQEATSVSRRSISPRFGLLKMSKSKKCSKINHLLSVKNPFLESVGMPEEKQVPHHSWNGGQNKT